MRIPRLENFLANIDDLQHEGFIAAGRFLNSHEPAVLQDASKCRSAEYHAISAGALCVAYHFVSEAYGAGILTADDVMKNLDVSRQVKPFDILERRDQIAVQSLAEEDHLSLGIYLDNIMLDLAEDYYEMDLDADTGRTHQILLSSVDLASRVISGLYTENKVSEQFEKHVIRVSTEELFVRADDTEEGLTPNILQLALVPMSGFLQKHTLDDADKHLMKRIDTACLVQIIFDASTNRASPSMN